MTPTIEFTIDVSGKVTMESEATGRLVKRDILRKSVFEIVIIVLGILIALGVDSLNSYRIDRKTERAYLGRLMEDTQENLTAVQRLEEALQRKRAALTAVADILKSQQTLHANAGDMVVALSGGADFGWFFPLFRTYTFDEIRSSGNLDLIVNLQLRSSLLGLHETLPTTTNRINARRTGHRRADAQARGLAPE
jgi:hypothetical protein